VNAAHALGETAAPDRVIRISLSQSSDGRVVVEVADNGCGMRDEVLSRAFEPFFTTKPLGVGAGLGLPICKRIVDDLGGTMTIQSKAGEGTTVSVSFPPALAQLPNLQPSAATPPPPLAPRRRILVVDDERAVAESLCAGLRDVHEVDAATSVAEARNLLAKNGEYDAVVCDVAMPLESGAVLHAYAKQHHPGLAERFIFMTGGAYTDEMLNFIGSTQCPHVEKPFGFDELRSLVDAAIARGRS
ncbi:MAG TPA: ATP-binding protein, partial [Polyangiales bacterium]|nr:ATP-binding protein [Polyangiales bacterium]